MMPSTARPKIVVGMLLMAAAALVFAAMHGLIRLAGQDVHPFEVGFLRSFFGSLFLLPLILRRGRAIWHTEHLKLHLFRSIVTVVATLLWFYALTVLPLRSRRDNRWPRSCSPISKV